MPTTYAHWRFGQDCIDSMPKELQEVVNQHRDIFDFGVHGPDIFFYDITHSEVVNHGVELHKKSAKEFFENCNTAYRKHQEDKNSALAYILGFLSHFTLDSTCHSYVDRKKEVSEISHNLIEAQWDRHIMILDNRTPNLVDRSESLKPSKECARVISYFHPVDEKAILRALKGQKTIISSLNCTNIAKENTLKGFLRTIGKNDFADLFVGFKEEETCKDSNLRLDKLKEKAIKLYPKLLDSLMAHINRNEKLDEYFKHDFGDWDDYKEIPILNYQEELSYKVK